MNEKKKLYIIIAVIAIILILIPTIILISNQQDQKYLDQLDEQLNRSEPTLVYVERPGCYFCNLLKPITDELKEDYQLTYYDINSSQLPSRLLDKVLKRIGVEDLQNFGTPYLAIVQNGKVLGRQAGYANEKTIFEFMKSYGFIKDGQLWYQSMTEEEFMNALPKSDKKYVFFGSDQISETLSMKRVLKELVKTTGKKIYYVELGNEKVSADVAAAFGLTVETFTPPKLIAIENGVITTAEANSKTAYENLLK